MRQDQPSRPPLIPAPKLRHHGRDLGWLVLVQKVAGVGEDVQLVLALHLGDHEGFVEPVGAGEEEKLGGVAGVEEFGAEVGEPAGPEGLGGG
jgi:hypothetical protein